MGKYNGAVITTAGQNLIAQAIAESKTVTFTTAQASSHVYPSSTDFEALTALTDVEKTVDINYAGVYSDTVVQVSARFDNDGVDTAYLINTLGFFAQLGTDTPILFAVSTAVTPDQMPVFDADNPSAFIYNMQITVQNADSINVSVNPAGTVTVDQLNAVVSTINAKIGDLSDLTTDNKTSLVNAVNEVDSHADSATTKANTNATHIGTLSSLTTTAKDNLVAAINEVDSHADAAQQMIAPILSSLVAPSGGLASGDQFIYNGLLYKATTAIAQGGTITIGGNCALADSVTGQIKTFKDKFHYSSTPSTLRALGETALTDSRGNSLLYNDVIVLSVTTPNDNLLCIPYYYSGVWAAQVRNITGAYASGTITINVLYVDRNFYL